MNYLFLPNPTGDYLKDHQRGDLLEFPDGVENPTLFPFISNEGIEYQPIPKSVRKAELFMIDVGYGPTRLITCLELMMTHSNDLANHPRLVAVYQWTQTIRNESMAGSFNLPHPPFTFEEVLMERSL
jgi:hypothetical protein